MTSRLDVIISQSTFTLANVNTWPTEIARLQELELMKFSGKSIFFSGEGTHQTEKVWSSLSRCDFFYLLVHLAKNALKDMGEIIVVCGLGNGGSKWVKFFITLLGIPILALFTQETLHLDVFSTFSCQTCNIFAKFMNFQNFRYILS